ncbi:nicotinate-nucleotide--dimethylbenzimidazole phosphoribosyltransferase [Actinomycetota bacterium]
MSTTTITPPSAAVLEEARERFDALAKPLGSLGRLEELGAWVASCQGVCPPKPLDRVRAVIPAGDHGVTTRGVASYPREITVAMVHTLVAGKAGMSALAAQHNVPVRVLDISVDAGLEGLPTDVTSHKLGRGCGSIDVEDAMTRAQAEEALAVGARIVAEELEQGAQLLIIGDLGIGNTTPSAALVAALTGSSAAPVTGRGAGLDDEGLSRKTAVVEKALARTTGITDPVDRLAALGSPDMAVAVGMMLAAAAARLPVLLDGVISVAEALVAASIDPEVVAWMQAGHRSPEPASGIALDSLGLAPILDLGMRLGEGTGAMTALPVLRSGVAVLRDMALLADLMTAE